MAVIIGLVSLAMGCLLGWATRYFIVEPDQMQALCAAVPPPAWCAARLLLIELTFRGTWGLVAVGAAVAAWVLRGPAPAVFVVIALLAGGIGLYLYDTNWAASAVLAALLRLPRLGEDPSDPREFSA